MQIFDKNYISNFLAVFLTVLVTSPQHKCETQAGLEHPEGVPTPSQSEELTRLSPELQQQFGTERPGLQGRHPELSS